MILKNIVVSFAGHRLTPVVELFVNGNYRVELIDAETAEPFTVINRWLPNLPEDALAIDTNNHDTELVEALVQANVIEPRTLVYLVSGYCRYPVHRLTRRVLSAVVGATIEAPC